jgi:GntR family transcriptional regulator/MocR family aminotransferase
MITLTIDRSLHISIIRQIYQQICNSILNNILKPGQKLPSSRSLSEDLNVSRNVVLEAYQLLFLEGYIFSKPHVGMFVSKGIHLQKENIPIKHIKEPTYPINDNIVDFRTGIPALELFPKKKWLKIRNDIFLDAPNINMSYNPGNGPISLKNSICLYLQRMRGLKCDPQQIAITNCSIQTFSILSRLLLKSNAKYIIEDPCHTEIQKVLMLESKNSISIPVDKEGLQTHLLPKDIQPAFTMVTPSHQYPLGGVLPAKRRIELIKYAHKQNSYIIEDDYDSEFRYDSSPLTPLYSLAPDIVIYVGTFSKILFPAIRIGYVILPWQLLDEFSKQKTYTDYFNNTIDQLALAKFIDNTFLDQHIMKMKKCYRKRRDQLILSLKETFGKTISISGESTGLHLIVKFSHINFSNELMTYLATKNIIVHPVWKYCNQSNYPKNSLVMGYSHLDIEKISVYIYNLHRVVGEYKDSPKIG